MAAQLTYDEVQAIQLAKLRTQVVYLAEHSDFYRDKLAGAATVESFDAFTRFPLTTKQEVRDSQAAAPPLGRHACVGLDDVIRLHASTGTTGVPSWVGVTRNDARVWTDLTAASFRAQGIRREDVVIHAAGLTLFVGGLPAKDAFEQIGAAFVPIGTGASEKVIGAMQTLGRTVLHSTPSYAVYLAEYARKHDIDPRSLNVRKLTVGGEPGGGEAAVRERIESEWGAPVTEGLGGSETAPIIWGECEHQQGMHLTGAEWVYAELIDPDSGASVPWETGAEAELVYTALERECCGLLRFRTRDRVRVLGMDCACGLPGPRIRCIGRTDDMLIVLGVNVFPTAIRDIVAELHPRTTGAMQVVLAEEEGPKVTPPLRILVEHAAGATDLDGLRDSLESAIRGRLSVSAAVTIVQPESIPRSEMKTALTRVERSSE
jgi:phenylacetate-CoA ligase